MSSLWLGALKKMGSLVFKSSVMFWNKMSQSFCCFWNWKQNPPWSEPHHNEISQRIFIRGGENINSAMLTIMVETGCIIQHLSHSSCRYSLQLSQQLEIFMGITRNYHLLVIIWEKVGGNFLCCIFLLPDLCFQAAGEKPECARGFLDDANDAVHSTSDSELTSWVSGMGWQNATWKISLVKQLENLSHSIIKTPTDQEQ